ncbi:DUF2207 domain-containing protein [Modestobacter marinus]|uniref:DUF2207 domain-containing protein n=1 Tax=Modestobacter marinus TaxID=477641 RepID=A0A846LZQ1_9ACTN|nr:DUF2207 domain-containing protein [Modestobacter marinus]NIH68909.1 hypothetical protein [Modestobacter marinus]GGL78974.1 hypothetical protein GCM10011589_38890 [Modestobacter marinus]
MGADGRRAGLAGLVFPALLLAGCTDGGPEEAIRSYEVDLVAAEDGSLQVEETIAYDFADSERHGIERLIPERAPYEQTRDRLYPISDVTVQSPTGAPADTEVTSEDGVLTVRVGDEDTEVTGRHTYVLSYRVDGVADPGDDGDRLAWNAVGTGWDVPIDEVDVQLSAPAGPVGGDCAVGADDSRTACPVDRTASGDLRAQATGLAPGEGVTVSGTYPAGTFAGAEPVLEETFSPAQAFRATPTTAGLAVGALLALVVPALLRARRGRPARAPGPGAPQLTPPHDARPAELGTVLDGRAQRHEVIATLLDLAVRGQLRIEETDPDDPDDAEQGDGGQDDDGPDDDGVPSDWRLVRTPADPRGLRPYERQLLDDVFADGAVVRLSDLQSRFTAVESRACAAMYQDVVERGWFRADPAAVRRRWYVLGAGVLVAGVVLTVVLAATSTWALAGSGVVLAGLVLLGLAGRMPQRTPEGAEVHERAAAFRDHLAASDAPWVADLEQLAGPARTDLRLRHLPHAVALGVAEEWTARAQAAGPGTTPTWYRPADGAGHVAVWPALLAFSSPQNPALSPPASAGSGTGATYVGGAAGGGGGGSW